MRLLMGTMDAVAPESVLIAFYGMRRHQRAFGIYPNPLKPKTFSEKLLHRMIFDRRPILRQLQDKYAVRAYVRDRVGTHILPALYWVTKNPADIPFDDLPDKFVVKATHGCGWNHLVPDKTKVNRQDLIDKCTTWLRLNCYYQDREWAYKDIEPRIIVEQFISDGTGLAPTEYKLYVFHGQVHLIWVTTGRFVDERADSYTPSWRRLSMKRGAKLVERPMPRPPHLDEMIRCAEILGGGLDFIRVDLYEGDQVYFGEMTVYPSGGLEFYEPKWNWHFGRLWDPSSRKAQILGWGGRPPL
jgi:hypothetical protein